MTTPRRELPPRYDAAAVEPAIYERWLASGAFTPPAEPPPGTERFVITMPPPNVTGSLHVGHALFVTLEDMLTRYHRMRGDDTLWLPGVDHASIAAQFVLDKVIAEEGETRESLGREPYLERMWRFMDETRDVIGLQMRRLGASADWTRNRFTMDPMSARAVRTAFKRLHDGGLVYRGEALVNWCPRCRTTISDLEKVPREETGTLWTIRYHLAREDGTPDPDHWIAVATTRPETVLGDVAVAVNPDDERYAALVGREAILPFLGRRLPIIADPVVERDFGTGAVKITPAHDPDDYETGRRHGLPAISIFDEEARLNAEGGKFEGLDRFEARNLIVEELRSMGDLEGETPHLMVIGRCDRCGTVIEPRLSVQWFVRTRPLADRALASVRDGRTRIVPEHFTKVYAHWMENIRDWAVGRQLWWGHRIPAWYCPDGHITITDAEAGPNACGTCGRPASELTQETDILDTWFSSGLWPFSTLGWPDDTPDMRRFYPTSVMETGYDIIFFWVARMMMLGLYLTDVEPFHTVYLHGLVRADGGVKMGKTKGNTVDPLEVMDEIGADALRFALTVGTTPGADLERRSLRAWRAARAARRAGWRADPGRALDPLAAGRGDRARDAPARRAGALGVRVGRPRLRLERLLRLVFGDGKGGPAPTGRIRRRAGARLAQRCRLAGRPAAAAAPDHAVRDRGDLVGAPDGRFRCHCTLPPDHRLVARARGARRSGGGGDGRRDRPHSWGAQPADRGGRAGRGLAAADARSGDPGGALRDRERPRLPDGAGPGATRRGAGDRGRSRAAGARRINRRGGRLAR